MVENKNNNSGCLFPFGGDFLPLIALLILDNEERRRRAEELEEEDEELIAGTEQNGTSN